ncbi:Coenzyme F420 hydrogenase/dehydrogenase, beta subunit C-terminal domain [bacterium]|nr:Coenzyme F420 hydrogenase/dehydrogenase, beta subunit C-terminal domain [bacterium]
MFVAQNGNCCGCTTCREICPKNVITIDSDEKGFMFPRISNSCVNCKLCEKNCPQLSKPIKRKEKQEVFIAKRKNEKLRLLSQSGGAFSVFAEKVLYEHGVVYGVSLDNNLNAKYIRVNKEKSLQRIRGSKYVQASVGSAFQNVNKDLVSGKKVLFSGTPCHVHGLLCYLKSKRTSTANLITVDFICHGVVSPMIYNDYKMFLEKLYNRKIKHFNFRDKQFGWHGHVVTVKTNKSTIISEDYVKLFYSHYALRESCYQCKYSNLNRVSDITIGDSWGIEKTNAEFDDNKGCSIIIINSLKGKNIFEETCVEFLYYSSEIHDFLQHNLQKPTPRPELTDSFWEDYKNYGFEYSAFKYCNVTSENDIELIRRRYFFSRIKRKLHVLL